MKKVQRYSTSIEMLEHAFEKHKNLPAYTCMGRTLTFGDMDTLSYRFACYLRHDLKLEVGDRIALQLPNILQFPVAFYGAVRAGLIVVNSNPLYTPREIRHQLRDSGAKAIVVLSNVAHNAASIIKETDVEHIIVTNLADLHAAPKRILINAVVKYVKKLVPSFTFDKIISFRATLKRPTQTLQDPGITPESTMFLQYTGGTTGVSKGAILTHKNMTGNVWQMISHMPEAFSDGKEVFVACLPLYHIYAVNIHTLSAFSVGAHNVLIPNPRDLASVVRALKPHQMTVFAGINALYNALCRYEPFRVEVDFSKLNVACAGGTALTKSAADLWTALTGVSIVEGYGLTETSPVVCSNYYDDIQPGTIGYAVAGTELKAIDDDGNEVAYGEPGELCVRGVQVMKGYWNKPEETKEAIDEDGWFKTGDIVTISEKGNVKIVDRKKDMILVSGFNVYPNEVEEVVVLLEKVIEAAVVGVLDARSGEAVKLFVVTLGDDLTEEDIYKHCRKNLTAYKVPKTIEFRECLPKTNVGKILRRELREAKPVV